ncbi:hypothetical protein KUCAC02_015069 [Chaenocephalus aceratus]|uniref:Uncharacterized protein n=1 Tax=Chaenocephalus aceratus TaxID=36190 RepID=A0ACB9XXM4_CHAAC|nr:hypothetical protein KUCAC02_015069 [Chaenocephalus aceratus]
MPLSGKVALVTGGAQGIGRAVVQSLLQSSAKKLHVTGPAGGCGIDLNKTCGEESKALLDAESERDNCHFIPVMCPTETH